MSSGIIETYRGFHICMNIAETPVKWSCDVWFEREDGDSAKGAPAKFSETAHKIEAGALNIAVPMVNRAESLINQWYERGNG
jgi:hypothetical protein